MDDSIRAKFPDDDHVLGPFLGNLPPEILDVVVENLGWFQTTFAMAGRTCREAVERVPSTRAVLTEEERERLQSWTEVPTAEEIRRLQSQGMTLAVAAVEGDVEALEWLIQLFDAKGLEWRSTYDGTELSGLAAKRGKLESLTCLRANGWPWDGMTCALAAEEGTWRSAVGASERVHVGGEDVQARSGGGGHLEVLQWARENGCKWDERTCSAAAEGGHLLVLQWARQNVVPVEQVDVRGRGGGGHLEVLQWAHQNGCPWDAKTCAEAAGRAPGGVAVGASERVPVGREDVLGRGEGRPPGGVAVGASERVPVGRETCQYAAQRRAPGGVAVGASERVPVGQRTCAFAAEGGHLEVLQWARQSGCTWDLKAWLGAHPRCRPYLIEHGCPGTEVACDFAATEGDLELLQWARQNGCPWDESTCTYAARGGHLEVLQWARQNGCPWNEWTCREAAKGGYLEVLQWARQNGCPWDEQSWHLARSNCRPYWFELGCPE